MTTKNPIAVLIIDFINDIVNTESKIARSAKYVAEHHVISRANKTIEFARENNLLLLFVKVGFNNSYLECPINSPIFGRLKQLEGLQLNTWSTEFHHELAFKANDPVIIKHRVSAFYNTDLETNLRAQKIQKLIICGVATDLAVQLTAREAHDRDYEVIIVEDACGASDENIHKNTIETLARVAKIVKSSELNLANL